MGLVQRTPWSLFSVLYAGGSDLPGQGGDADRAWAPDSSRFWYKALMGRRHVGVGARNRRILNKQAVRMCNEFDMRNGIAISAVMIYTKLSIRTLTLVSLQNYEGRASHSLTLSFRTRGILLC